MSPTPWVENPTNAELLQSLVGALSDIHDMYVEGSIKTKASSNRVYGQMHADLAALTHEAIRASFPEAALIGNAIRMDEVTVVPWRTPGGRSHRTEKFITSEKRGQLFTRSSSMQPNLFDQDSYVPAPEESSLIMIAMESTRHGITNIFAGEVAANADGTLRWIDDRVVFTPERPMTAEDATPGRNFTEGDIPQPRVVIRKKAL